MRTCKGSYHCGSTRFEIDSNLIAITTCDCSLCVKKNAVMVKVHEDQFGLISGEKDLGLYQWNTGVA